MYIYLTLKYYIQIGIRDISDNVAARAPTPTVIILVNEKPEEWETHTETQTVKQIILGMVKLGNKRYEKSIYFFAPYLVAKGPHIRSP